MILFNCPGCYDITKQEATLWGFLGQTFWPSWAWTTKLKLPAAAVGMKDILCHEILGVRAAFQRNQRTKIHHSRNGWANKEDWKQGWDKDLDIKQAGTKLGCGERKRLSIEFLRINKQGARHKPGLRVV